MPVCGEREVTIVVPSPAWLSITPCFHGSPVFLHRHSLLRISSLLSPQSISPQPTAVVAPGLFSNPHAPAPSPLAHLWSMSQSGACRAVVRTICVFLILSHLPQIGSFTLFQQPRMLPFCPTWFPHQRRGFPKFGNLSSASAPLPQCAGPIPLPLLLFLPSFFPSYPVMQGFL